MTRAIARQLRASMVKINGAAGDLHLPFGGISSPVLVVNGVWGLDEYLETKAVIG